MHARRTRPLFVGVAGQQQIPRARPREPAERSEKPGDVAGTHRVITAAIENEIERLDLEIESAQIGFDKLGLGARSSRFRSRFLERSG